MGHSTDVPLPQRVSIWVELVPLFLAYLHIKHVALASHSAGTIYLFNTLLRCRDILHPTKPLVSLVAPWVDPAHSHVATMQMVQYLPTSVFGVWHQIPKFAAAGGAMLNGISKLLPSSSGMNNAVETQPLERNRQRVEREYGLDVELQRELATLSFKAIFGENTAGANSEALQCLRKGPAGLWGDCEDYGAFVGKVGEVERGRGGWDGGEKLRIRVYFAESDALIGKKGQRYMEECWKGSRGDKFEDVLNFVATTIGETDHDSVVQSVECLEQIFISAGGVMPEDL